MRSYEKSNPEKSIIESKQKKTAAIHDSAKIPIKDAGQNYRKAEGVRLPFTFLVIVSGGEKRERDYFKKMMTSDRLKQQIKIEFVPDPDQGNPDRLFDIAKSKQEQYQTSQEEEPDKIFIVSDVDHFISELLRIKPKCEALDIKLIISNSCFEVWLYYSKFSSKPTDFKIPANPLKISQSFKRYNDEKVKGGIDPRKAIFDIQANINNAKNNYEDENGIPKLFSTNMFLLAESLLPFMPFSFSNKLTP